MQSESDTVKIARLEERIGGLINTVNAMQGENRARLDKQDAQLARLVAAFNMGEGRAIAVAKIGGLMVLAAGAVAWLIDHAPGWVR
jgi:hypothetical protein